MMTSATLSPTCPMLVSMLLGLGRLTVRTDAPYILFFFLSLFSLLCQIDVTDIPNEGSWLQLIKDGTTQINTGPNGIQRLDKLIEIAKSYNIYVYFSLTNNWFPPASASVPPSSLPRNFLSNNYGRYLILFELCAIFPDCIFLRWYGHLRSRVWRIKDT